MESYQSKGLSNECGVPVEREREFRSTGCFRAHQNHNIITHQSSARNICTAVPLINILSYNILCVPPSTYTYLYLRPNHPSTPLFHPPPTPPRRVYTWSIVNSAFPLSARPFDQLFFHFSIFRNIDLSTSKASGGEFVDNTVYRMYTGITTTSFINARSDRRENTYGKKNTAGIYVPFVSLVKI